MYVVSEAPTDFTAATISSTAVQLSWNMPDVTNGILIHYTLVYTDNVNTSTVTYDNDTFAATVTDLNEDSFYLFAIYANTNAGAGPNSTVSATTFEDSK